MKKEDGDDQGEESQVWSVEEENVFDDEALAEIEQSCVLYEKQMSTVMTKYDQLYESHLQIHQSHMALEKKVDDQQAQIEMLTAQLHMKEYPKSFVKRATGTPADRS